MNTSFIGKFPKFETFTLKFDLNHQRYMLERNNKICEVKLGSIN